MMQRSQPTDTTTARPGRRRPLARLLPTALAGVWLAGLPSPGAAELYRWVDETGTIVYSQHPPPGTTPAAAIKPPPAPSTQEVQRATQRLRSQVEQDFDQREQQTRDAEQASKKATEEATRKANCEGARANLATLEDYGNARLRGPDGKYMVLSTDALAKEKAQARKQIQDNCK